MRTGGYQIIDLKNVQLTAGTGHVFPGIYDSIESTHKAILVSGMNVGGTEFHDTFVEVSVDGSNFIFTCNGYDCIVEDTDVLTATAVGG